MRHLNNLKICHLIYLKILEFTWRSRNVVVRGSQCNFEENNPTAEKNFALEKYGRHSKCFEHSDKMWEERSCTQTREWQHFGSGCYTYTCTKGRIHIHVSNYTFECFHTGQSLDIRIFENNWLKMGVIKCPPCDELCDDEFAAIGETCMPSQKELPSSHSYPKDNLKCNAALHLPMSILIPLSFVFVRLQSKFSVF